ncbi:MAG: type IV pilus biogenesis/stability protein PilW [Alcanivoracaceae bacterium]|jgi:type IV pilus assembly protein PilF|nr:type IV pilus biogenesis/stability protein PilW [Alcanivoracaceae bacterium]
MKVATLITTRSIATVLVMLLAGCMVLETQTPPNADMAVSRRISAGFEYLQMGQPSEARRHISRALELEPRSAEAHNAMALLYRYEGDQKRAEEHFRKSIRYDRDFSLARNNYGAMLLALRRYDEALEQFSIAADDPSYDKRSIAFENKGRALSVLGREDEALEAFNTSMRLDSESIDPLLEMAWIYFRRDDMRMASRVYSAYEQRAGAQPARGLWLGIQLAARENKADKLASFELALDKLYPGSAEHREWRNWVAQGRKL